MTYLIKSVNRSENSDHNIYWGPDESGYTAKIVSAGLYSTEVAARIVNRSSGNAEMIPFTKELRDLAKEQLEKEINTLETMKKYEYKRHMDLMRSYDSDIQKSRASLATLEKNADLLMD